MLAFPKSQEAFIVYFPSRRQCPMDSARPGSPDSMGHLAKRPCLADSTTGPSAVQYLPVWWRLTHREHVTVIYLEDIIIYYRDYSDSSLT